MDRILRFRRLSPLEVVGVVRVRPQAPSLTEKQVVVVAVKVHKDRRRQIMVQEYLVREIEVVLMVCRRMSSTANENASGGGGGAGAVGGGGLDSALGGSGSSGDGGVGIQSSISGTSTYYAGGGGGGQAGRNSPYNSLVTPLITQYQRRMEQVV